MTVHRPRIRPRISAANYLRLHDAAKKPDASLSLIVDKALSSYFSYERDDRRDAKLIRRLDLMTRHDYRHSRDLNMLTEAFSLFLRYFFSLAPDIKEGEQDRRQAKGALHFNNFVDQLKTQMKLDGRIMKLALADVMATEDQYFTKEELELLAKLDGKKLKKITAKKTKKVKVEAKHVSA
ncbi:MAG: hypothetical protein JKY25_09185 [Robiginitomaculum sp.]|nr:hypothetical protein [Robiginitomaculum sp.]